MSPDEKQPTAENEVPKDTEQDSSLTKEEFTAQMQRLAERARAAGLSPLKAMFQVYAQQGLAIADIIAQQGQAIANAILRALEENADSPKKKG